MSKLSQYAITEAVEPFRLHPTSMRYTILHIYNVVEHIDMLSIVIQQQPCYTVCVGQDGNRVVRMSTHRVKNPGIGVRMSTHHKNPGIVMHHLKKAGMVRQMPESPESPYVQRNSTGTTRVARTNPRWRREHARGKE
jgi:hypothetical protein